MTIIFIVDLILKPHQRTLTLYMRNMYIHLSVVSRALAVLGVSLTLVTSASSTSFYSNTTLRSADGDLEVVVYLPVGVKPTESTFYVSSRFDHSSMIGSMKRRTHQLVDGEMVKQDHFLFGGELWRRPHNSQFPESGIGIAAEFGVGDDGAFCFFKCGWDGINDITNGLLGYDEARNGEPFLKSGVGALIKGSCPTCDSTDNYRFNSPYEFAELPQWNILQSTSNVVSMEHQAIVKNHGYRLHKNVVLNNNELLVTTILTNLGSQPFSTAWYSHNFFTCDAVPVREGYSVDLKIRGQRGPGTRLFEEPGLIGSWAAPMQQYATVKEYPDHVSVDVFRPLDDSTRIKAEFTKDKTSRGKFSLSGCGTTVKNDFPEVMRGEIPMYAYNLYLEKGTISPEPQLLIQLSPGESKSWTQRLVIEDTEGPETKKRTHLLFGIRSISLTNSLNSESAVRILPVFLVAVVTLLTLIASGRDSARRRRAYSQVPDIAA